MRSELRFDLTWLISGETRSHSAGKARDESITDHLPSLPRRSNCFPGARVHIITFALHTAHIFQVLDLALFRVPKRRGQ
jgi:hypothetical protein